MVEWIAAGILVLTGLAHSVAGERRLITPLLANKDWRLAELPRSAADPLLRFCWHLVTIAWFAAAAMLVGAPVAITFAVMALSSAVWIFVMLPGHLGWTWLLPAGLLALWAAGGVAPWLLWSGVGVGVVVAIVVAGFHVAWALGSTHGVANVIPQDPGTGERTFAPRPIGTFAVAGALLSYAALVGLAATGTGPGIVAGLVTAAAIVLALRVFGEGRYVGVFKRIRHTGFARSDDKYWTPLAALLALGAWAALAIGA